jgi:hypothetical protein
MSRHNDFEYEWLNPYLGLAGALVFCYGLLWYHYPVVAAVFTAVLLVLGTGLFTTKVIFCFENPRLAWGLAPVFGGGWLLLLWILWNLRSWF